LSEVPHPQGVLAVAPMQEERDLPVPSASLHPLIVIADGVRDPGNLGTLIRSAAGAGADHLVIGPETVDPYHPRAVRAAMGCHFRLPISHRTWEQLAPILRNYEVIGLADATGDAVYDTVRWTLSSAIVIGGEAFGPSAEANGQATVRVSIPLARGVESLNAGVAGSLLVFEAARQRRASRTSDNG
jgi:TrmH family RNA methyltransferase